MDKEYYVRADVNFSVLKIGNKEVPIFNIIGKLNNVLNTTKPYTIPLQSLYLRRHSRINNNDGRPKTTT